MAPWDSLDHPVHQETGARMVILVNRDPRDLQVTLVSVEHLESVVLLVSKDCLAQLEHLVNLESLVSRDQLDHLEIRDLLDPLVNVEAPVNVDPWDREVFQVREVLLVLLVHQVTKEMLV